MIYIVTADNRDMHSDILHQQFRIRHAVFVKERGWHEFERPNDYEMDQYDNENAIYVIAAEDERVIGGFRLHPTIYPHMLVDSFSHLLSETAPTGLNIYEWTRIFIVRDRRDSGIWYTLAAALHEFCLARAIVSVTAVIQMARLAVLRTAGFNIRPLGLPEVIGGDPTIAVQIKIDEEALVRIRRAGNLNGPVISCEQMTSTSTVH